MGRDDYILDSYLDPPEPQNPNAYEDRWYALEDILYDEMTDERMCPNG